MSFLELPDLASRRLGGGVVACNDEFFAAADNLVEPAPAVFSPKTFGAKGQVYDGWETRRRREPGHDWAIVRLGVPGVVSGVVIDTAWFTGNYPPYASVDGAVGRGLSVAGRAGRGRLARTAAPLAAGGRHRQPVPGVAARPSRSRTCGSTSTPTAGWPGCGCTGEPVPDRRFLGLGALVDLAAIEHGGRVVGLQQPVLRQPEQPAAARVRPRRMGEGWETARRRDDGNDWVLVRLGLPGVVTVAELDTSHFKGNAPGWARLTCGDDLSTVDSWVELLPRTRLQPDTRHRFLVSRAEPATHVRLDVYPDGGMARLRLLGRPSGLT